MGLWTAFTLGLFGSLHCVGMCGPLALSVPGQNDRFLTQLLKGISYNFGRIVTYAIIGFFLGFLGVGATLAGFQNVLSIVLGLLIILFILFPKLKFMNTSNSFYTKFYGMISMSVGKLIRKRTIASTFSIGILNGFLPCGLVVTALAAALITPSAYHSMFYMAFFGLGTIPIMLMLNVAPSMFSLNLRQKLRPLTTYFAIFIGILLIARGILISTPGNMSEFLQGANHECIVPVK